MEIWNSGGYAFETDMSLNNGEEDDEMAAFEAECAKMLEQEHKRRAREENEEERSNAAEAIPPVAVPAPEQPVTDETESRIDPVPAAESEPEREPEPEMMPASDQVTLPENDSSEEAPPQKEIRKPSHREELVAIMQAESDESMMHEAIEAEKKNQYREYDEEKEYEYSDGFPQWLRILFSVFLLLLGGAGIYTMIGMDYHSRIFDPLCFIEISVCMLTAMGLISSPISFRVGKEIIMRLTGYSLFIFYSVYAADALFLKKLLSSGINTDGALTYARAHVHADIASGLTSMGTSGMIGCALFVAPFAFLLLMLLRPFRHFLLYVLTIAFIFFAVGAVRILTMSGSFSLSHCFMGMVGALVAYVLFMLPPVQALLSNAGLMLWDFDEDED